MLNVDFRHALGGFSLDVRLEATAGIQALFGPSGAGKSSVIQAIAGLMTPRDGRITLGETVLFDSARGVNVAPRHRRIATVFQDARLFPHLTVEGNLLYGWKRQGRPVAPAEIARLIALLGLEGLVGRRPHTLSGGERQRVALGRALLMGPRLMLLDEPLSGLDHARKQDILPYLERLRDEARVPMLYVSHALDEVTRLADAIALIDAGRIVAAGSVMEIMGRLDLVALTGRLEAGAVVEGALALQHEADGLSEIAFEGGRLLVPWVEASPGARVRLRIRARDVILARGRPEGLSALNILPARVVEIRPEPPSHEEVALDIGATRILARITRRARRELGIEPGVQVHAVIKSVSLDARIGRQSGR